MRSAELPPPPAKPDRPPPRILDGEASIRLHTIDGVHLESLGRLPSHATRAVILCHPHPLYGGTMSNALILTLTRMIAEQGSEDLATLRFNFRGVEGSEGRYDEGHGELLDVKAAIAHVKNTLPHAKLSVVGYSFGSWVGLRAAWTCPEVERIALVAPAIRFSEEALDRAERRPLPTEIVLGDRDSFVDVPEARRLAERLGARLHVIDGADHFFVRQRRLVGTMLLPFVVPEAV